MKRMHWIAIMMVALCAFAIVIVACSSEDEEGNNGPCTADSECGAGFICNLLTSQCQASKFCTSDASCDAGMYCRASACRSAILCNDSDDCDDEFHCTSDGYCFPGEEVAGSCETINDCDYGERCVSGRCIDANTCPEGSEGCACYGDDTCDGGLTCEYGTCVSGGSTCTQGTEDCSCRMVPPRCDDDLVCQENVCVEDGGSTCVEGNLNCPCYANDTCNDELICENDVCVEDSGSTCPDGTLNCPCFANDTCSDELVCENDVCVEGTQPPAGMKAKFCNGLSSSLTGLAYICAMLDSTSLQANEMACGACVTLPESMAQTAPIFDMTNCNDTQSMVGGAQALNGPLDSGYDYIIVLKPDQKISFLQLDSGGCETITYQQAQDQAAQARKTLPLEDVLEVLLP